MSAVRPSRPSSSNNNSSSSPASSKEESLVQRLPLPSAPLPALQAVALGVQLQPRLLLLHARPPQAPRPPLPSTAHLARKASHVPRAVLKTHEQNDCPHLDIALQRFQENRTKEQQFFCVSCNVVEVGRGDP